MVTLRNRSSSAFAFSKAVLNRLTSRRRRMPTQAALIRPANKPSRKAASNHQNILSSKGVCQIAKVSAVSCWLTESAASAPATSNDTTSAVDLSQRNEPRPRRRDKHKQDQARPLRRLDVHLYPPCRSCAMAEASAPIASPSPINASARAAFTRSRSSFPGLKWGTYFPDRPTDSPVFGFRPIRGAR